MSITSAAGLVEALSKYRILDQPQLDKLHRALQGRSPDPRALAKEIVKHGWVTTFQVNQLLKGCGAELVLGEYLLLDRLGEGGMGEVFKARHRLMNRIVALKVIRKERLANADSIQRFHREIQMAAQLDHPNLVRAHDAAQVGDTHFLVMEYAEGVSLYQMVENSGPLPGGQACSYIRQAALGLQHASERKMVHRDIKPSNLQVTAQGTVVKVLDMGLARSQAAEGNAAVKTELTQASSILGTPDYIAPEQIDDPRRVDIRADIYSLGCTFYFVLAGQPPFPDCAWHEKLVNHGKVEPQPIEQIRAEVPPALAVVLRKMMAKRPDDRYATPAAVAEALTPYTNLGVSAPDLAGAASKGQPQSVAMPAGTASASVPAAPANSLVPPGGYEAGWTLGLGSTVSPALAPSTQGEVRALFAEQTVPGPGPRHFWLVVAGGGAVLILLLILLWPKGGAPGPNTTVRGASSDLAQNPGGDPPGVAPITKSLGMKFAKVPKGTFWMSRDEKNAQRQVTIDKDFELGTYEVTQGEWLQVMGGTNPSHFSRDGGGKDSVQKISDEELRRFPVEGVRWDDVQEFLKKLNEKERGRGYTYYLPTEKEWEYACRGGATSKEECSYDFYFRIPTNDLSSARANFGDKCTTKVGSYEPNRLGLYDMHGNVWEWTATAGASARVFRGGGWNSEAVNCRAASRDWGELAHRYIVLGLRVARVPVR